MSDGDAAERGSGAGRAAPDGWVNIDGSDRGHLVLSETREAQVVQIETFGTGTASHLGQYSRLGQHLVDLETFVVSRGTFTLTAANGDTIHGTYAGHAGFDRPGVLGFEVSGQITGGTGRFSGTSGHLTFVGFADLATSEFTETLSGAVTPRGSTR